MDRLARETLEQAHGRFEKEASRLAALALNRALARAGVPARRLDFLAATTCTAYLCPGLSSHAAERAALRPDAVRLDLAGMGCAAALPALEAARGFLAAHPGGTAAVVCAELGSAAFSPGDDPDLVVSNALFGDGAAAAVLGKGKGLLRFSGFSSFHEPRWREEIRFRWEKGRLRNALSPDVPARAAEGMARVMAPLIGRRATGAIDHWALHPGGAKVMDAVRDRLGLGEEALSPARAVLKRFGNMSSPSCLFVLDHILRRRPRRGESGVLASFGAGFSAHAALLEF